MATNGIIRALINLAIGGLFAYTGSKFFKVDKTFLNRSIALYFCAEALGRLNIAILLISFWGFGIEEPYGFPRTYAFSVGEYAITPFVIVMLLELSGILLRVSQWMVDKHNG